MYASCDDPIEASAHEHVADGRRHPVPARGAEHVGLRTDGEAECVDAERRARRKPVGTAKISRDGPVPDLLAQLLDGVRS